jgi:hypothetical protein
MDLVWIGRELRIVWNGESQFGQEIASELIATDKLDSARVEGHLIAHIEIRHQEVLIVGRISLWNSMPTD